MTLHTEYGLFKLDPLSILPYEKKDNVWISVTLERNLDLIELQRNTYTFFEYVSDLGGLYGFLFPVSMILISVLKFHSFDNAMVQNLFRVSGSQKPPDDRPGG